MRSTAQSQEPRRVRCVIYTRKSTDDGLEQAFNSLDAQREACVAYIVSQRHEGWTLVEGDYDDGGFSGGTMERPRLKRLLAEVAAKRIDVIVLYKIDRLTRNLGDFARIVEILDAAGASFVSITQQFNTTTSMGRLTLNMLLSFAQFEREITGERIRDKIAASKARGMWMGGVVPLGYTVQDRKLVIAADEAATVNMIFRRYLQLGSVQALQGDLAERGIVARARRKGGELVPPKPMSRGALYLMLRNRIYVGDICHKGKPSKGEHSGFLDIPTFDAAQAMLNANKVGHQSGQNYAHISLLAGILYDAHGRRMSPTHTVKQVKRYRYYKSRTDGVAADQPVWRVPAGDIEQVVVGRLRAMLLDEGAVFDAIGSIGVDAAAIHAGVFNARKLAERLTGSVPSDLRATLLSLVARVEVHYDRVDLHIRRSALVDHPDEQGALSDETAIIISVAAKLARVGREVRMAIDPTGGSARARLDAGLIKLMVKAHAARALMESSPELGMEELARLQGHARDYYGVLIKLSYLAPDIVARILVGRQEPTLTRQGLLRMKGLGLLWLTHRHDCGVRGDNKSPAILV